MKALFHLVFLWN